MDQKRNNEKRKCQRNISWPCKHTDGKTMKWNKMGKTTPRTLDNVLHRTDYGAVQHNIRAVAYRRCCCFGWFAPAWPRTQTTDGSFCLAGMRLESWVWRPGPSWCRRSPARTSGRPTRGCPACWLRWWRAALWKWGRRPYWTSVAPSVSTSGRKVSTLESLGNGFHELPDYGSLLLPYFGTTLFCESFTFLLETIMLFCQPITSFHDNFHILTT